MLPVSVFIPARNEADNIAKLVESLRNQTIPPAEIIVVDGGSADDTAIIAAQTGARVIRVDRAYPGQGRNLAIAHAAYDIVAGWDASMRVAPDALEKLVQPILAGEAEIVWGHLEILPQTWAAAIYSLILAPLSIQQLPDGRIIRVPPVACSAFRKSLWKRIGGFSPWRAREDSDFRERVLALNPSIKYVPEATTYWEPAENWRQLLRKIRIYGRHNLLSGKPRQWYGGLVRVYGAYLLLSIGGGIAYGFAGGLLILLSAFLLGGFLRALRKVLQNGSFFAQKMRVSPFSPKIFLLTMIMLLSTDIASFMGVLDWLILDKLGLAPERFPEPKIIEELPPSSSV